MSHVNKERVHMFFHPDERIGNVARHLEALAKKADPRPAEYGAIWLMPTFGHSAFEASMDVLFTVPDVEPHLVRGDE